MGMGIKLSEVMAFTRGRWMGKKTSDLVLTGVSTDSRTIKPGELFVALRGGRFDGHNFIDEAVKAGALAVLAENDQTTTQPVIFVENSLKALGDLARHVRRQKSFKVLAITGSVGKTTVKEMVKNILQVRNSLIAPDREILATRGNLNNEIGLPLSILDSIKMKFNPTDAVLEMGASNPGDIKYLTEIARPDVGLVTAIGQAHLETFKDLKTVAKTKGELFKTMSPGSLAVVNKEDPYLAQELNNNSINHLFYGPGGQVWLKKSMPDGLNGQKLIFGGPLVNDLEVDLPLLGDHNAFNATAAVAAAIAMDCGLLEIKKGLNQTKSIPGRLDCIQTQKGYWIIDDSYNANPTSMEAGLKFLVSIPSGDPKVAILGDMLELGPEARTLHQDIGRLAIEVGVDYLALCGSLSKQMLIGARQAQGRRAKIEVFSTPEDAAEWAMKQLKRGGYILVKGSRAGALERAVETLKGI
jgi:UDP-N-acetylmuramoyl-tripeptide--D-alanyl-D-alanine ligase